jgi:hypothetical protein
MGTDLKNTSEQPKIVDLEVEERQKLMDGDNDLNRRIARKNANMKQRENDQEEIRLEAVARYNSGSLNPSFSQIS